MIWLIIGSIIILFLSYVIYDNFRIEFSFYDIKDSFDLTICHISDVHSRKLNLKRLLKRIDKINPDIIIYTGDIVDGYNDDLSITLDMFKALSSYKGFYSLGNHELRLEDKLNEYLDEVSKYNVTILQGSIIEYKGIKIKGELPIIKGDITKINKQPANIVLAHNPEEIKNYEGDIIFSGHAHGGQFRLFNRGLYSPDQGVFPRYSKGKYLVDSKKIFVSSGLGGKDFAIRLFNPPNINIVRIKKDKS